jgi:type II secretory pathway pseudopilin PulG
MQIHVARGQQQLGVFSLEDVQSKLASGELQPTDYGWSEGQTEWKPLSTMASMGAVPPSIAPAYASPHPQAATASYAAPTAPNSGLALGSLICGILGLTMFPFVASIPAVVCGHMARSDIKKSGGQLGGGGMALGGLITGYIGLLLLPLIIVMLAAIAVPVFQKVQQKALQTQSMSNGRQIATACRLYAVDHKGSFPRTLDELFPDYLADRHVLVCPVAGQSVPVGYEYYGGKDTDPGRNFLLVSKGVTGGSERVVVYVDSSAQVLKGMPQLPPHSR